TRALCYVNTAAGVSSYLPKGLKECEEALALYGGLGRDDWQEDPDWQRLSPGECQGLAEGIRGLLHLLALARGRTHTGGTEVARARTDRGHREAARRALALLYRAEAVRGLPPSQALWEDRAFYLERLGDGARAEAARARARQLQPATARDHYLVATTYARQGRYPEAVAALHEGLRLNPRHCWSLMQRGLCHLELGNHALAAGDFGACIGLWPEFAWGHFNRGYALEQSGHRAEAVRDYTAALDCDPEFDLAYFNRGLARL